MSENERGLDRDFTKAMLEGLDRGRKKGYHGWDHKWDGTVWHRHPDGVFGQLMAHLHNELVELTIAVHENDKKAIRSEAADVANLAMMVADYHGALENGVLK